MSLRPVGAHCGPSSSHSLSIEITGAPGGVSAGVADVVLQDRRRSEAAPMDGVEARRIAPGAVKPDGAGFRIDATAGKGAEGSRRILCLFKGDRTFDRIQVMTRDGE